MTDPNTDRKMDALAKLERRHDLQWGVVNPGNALCAAIFRTKWEAEAYRRAHACAYKEPNEIPRESYRSSV